MFYSNFFPLTSSFVKAIYIKTIKIAKYYSVTTWIKCSNCKIMNFFILCIIKSLHKVSLIIIKWNFCIISCCNNLFSSSQCIGNWMMFYNLLILIIMNIASIYWSIYMTWANEITISIRCNRNAICFSWIQNLRFIRFQYAFFNFSFSKTKINFIVWSMWPC